MRRFLAVAALLGLLGVEAERLRAEEALYNVGDTVVAAKVRNLDRREVSFSDHKGKIVFVNFFSLR